MPILSPTGDEYGGRVRIALFATCLGDVLFPDVPRATTALLERLGHEVVFPHDQACCGQMHVNTGYQRDALGVVRHHVEVFEKSLSDGSEAIVAPSGSCVGSVRHQHGQVARRLGDEELGYAPRPSPRGRMSSPSCWSTSSAWSTSAPGTRTA